jgi:hypothetical protein
LGIFTSVVGMHERRQVIGQIVFCWHIKGLNGEKKWQWIKGYLNDKAQGMGYYESMISKTFPICNEHLGQNVFILFLWIWVGFFFCSICVLWWGFINWLRYLMNKKTNLQWMCDMSTKCMGKQFFISFK